MSATQPQRTRYPHGGGHALFRLRDGETVAEAVAVHGEDLDKLLAKLNEGLAD